MAFFGPHNAEINQVNAQIKAENGKISGWGAAGISIGSSVTFAASYGFSYRHNIGFFNWELGWFWLALPSVAVKGSPYLGVGMDF